MNYYAQSKLYLSSNNSAATLNDVAYVQSSDYAKIIGKKKCNQSRGKKRMTIVKIQHEKNPYTDDSVLYPPKDLPQAISLFQSIHSTSRRKKVKKRMELRMLAWAKVAIFATIGTSHSTPPESQLD